MRKIYNYPYFLRLIFLLGFNLIFCLISSTNSERNSNNVDRFNRQSGRSEEIGMIHFFYLMIANCLILFHFFLAQVYQEYVVYDDIVTSIIRPTNNPFND
jgi:hypothetical protein